MQFGFGLFGAWWFSLIYLIFAYGLWFIFPKFVQIRFAKTLEVKYVSFIYKYLYFLLLVSSTYILFEINFYFYFGIILYIIGLTIYISAIYYFSINEIDLVVTSGIYGYSRHPVYLGFFIMWLGVAISCLSTLIFLLIILIGFFSYQIALSEENYCKKKYGKVYLEYSEKVNLIFGKK